MKEINQFILEKLRINKDNGFELTKEVFINVLIEYTNKLKKERSASDVIELSDIFDENDLPVDSLTHKKIKTIYAISGRRNQIWGWIDGDNKLILYNDLTEEQKNKIYEYILERL